MIFKINLTKDSFSLLVLLVGFILLFSFVDCIIRLCKQLFNEKKMLLMIRRWETNVAKPKQRVVKFHED